MTVARSARDKYRHIAYGTTFALTIFTSTLANPAFAGASGNASLSLSPAAQSAKVGSNLSLDVIVNTGGASTNAIAADITYPSNFSYVSFTDDPAFSTGSLATNKGTTLSISAGAIGKISGTHNVGTLKLRANAAGTGDISFSAICTGTGSHCSAVVDPTAHYANVLGSVKGGTLSATGQGTGSSTTSSAVGASNGSAGSTGSKNSTGADVTLTFVTKSGKPLTGAVVTLNGKIAKTNTQGKVTFSDVTAGTAQVTVMDGTKQTKMSITVGKIDPATKTNEKQNFTLTAEHGNRDWIYILIAVVTLLGLLLVVRPFLLSRRRKLPGEPVVPPVSVQPAPENPKEYPPNNQT